LLPPAVFSDASVWKTQRQQESLKNTVFL